MFRFRHFAIEQDLCAMKVGTDGVLLGAWADVPTSGGSGKILDIGTGTGIVALMMAQRFANATVEAIDIDPGAARQAKSNAERSIYKGRISVERISIQEYAKKSIVFDAITSNPPYFHNSLGCPDTARSTARHDHALPLSDLARCSARLLADGGELSVILPASETERMTAEASFAGLFLKRQCMVKTTANKKASRTLLAFTNKPCETLVSETLTIGDDRYRSLTADFYL